MECIYIKRFTKQDITKSYSPSTDATRDFFCVDLNMTQDYVDLNVCYNGNTECPPGITIHKGYQGEKDWRICGDNFKPLYAFRNPEEGDLSVWKRIGKNGNYKFTIQVVKKNDSDYLDYAKFLVQNDNHLFVSVDNEEYISDDINNNSSYISNFTQTIYYGVPGCGKSNEINTILKKEIQNDKDREFQVCRVVFHPEYTNADFVGQVLPRVKGGVIKYEFKPGPFAKILYRALHNPGKKFFLIIEEINRGNAAAIFGDIFQLLDRIESAKDIETIGGNTFGIGWSKYFIENDYINNYIRSKFEYSDAAYTEEHNNKEIILGENIVFSPNTSIRLPPNLSLYATMNTSDQNVFTLDNAFQRRWDMQLVPNECTDTNQMGATITVNKQKIMWKDFQHTINEVIGEKSNEGGLSSMEDKRLGSWFVKAENGEIKAEVFADKVLKYLWDDAFKFYHQEMFKGDIKNFEELHKRFLDEGFSVFSDECRLGDKLQIANTPTDSVSSVSPAVETSE